jgi:hypothetical protein
VDDFRKKSVVVPAVFPGRGVRIHHTLSAGIMVSTFMGLAVRMNVGSRIHVVLRMEQISIRSLKKEGMTVFEGVFRIVAGGSSSLSEDEDGGDEEEEEEEEEPKESSESGEVIRGVARIVLEGDPGISVGGRIC